MSVGLSSRTFCINARSMPLVLCSLDPQVEPKTQVRWVRLCLMPLREAVLTPRGNQCGRGGEGRTRTLSLGLCGSQSSRMILKTNDTVRKGFPWAPLVRPPGQFRNQTSGHFQLTLKKLVGSHGQIRDVCAICVRIIWCLDFFGPAGSCSNIVSELAFCFKNIKQST